MEVISNSCSIAVIQLIFVSKIGPVDPTNMLILTKMVESATDALHD